MSEISVLTLVKGRGKALENFLKGLKASKKLPEELIIVFMNEPIRAVPEMPFRVNCLELHASDQLPLAAARNLAAATATSNFLIFLDVDCIADPELISGYLAEIESEKLLAGQVRYLRKKATEDSNFLENLVTRSDPDPIRGELSEIPYELFWSLNFGCRKSVYQRIGGFDESFHGYGAEDTDFAFSARLQGVQLQVVAAPAYHQYHESYSPPLNHFADIVANAEVFFRKWKTWPMEGWLRRFREMGLLEKKPERLIVKRFPEAFEIEQALKT